MSDRWPGGIVRATPVTPAGPYQTDAAPGVWTLDQASYWIKQGLWPTAGNALVVEDAFSTYLYTGNNGAQSINNGLNLSGQGGLVWLKNRGSALSHILIDTAQGCTFAGGKNLISNSTNAAGTIAANTFQFDSTGFSFGSAASGGAINASGNDYASWTFRKAPKFFDVVAYTGNGSFSQTIPHNLGIAPGMIIVKRLDTTSNWWTYNRGIPGTINGYLNLTDAFSNSGYLNISGSPASSFLVYNFGGNDLNVNGGTYVAYLFAHDTSSTGFIQCGAYSGTGSAGNAINIGWEPQWLLVKNATSSGQEWGIFDNMRGLTANSSGGDAQLFANTSASEGNSFYFAPTPTGFSCEDGSARYNASGSTYVYVAIRRGPMKAPTLGTAVFSPLLSSATGTSLTSNFPADAILGGGRQSGYETGFVDRIRGFANTTTGNTNWLITQNSNADFSTNSAAYYNAWNTNTLTGPYLGSGSFVNYVFRRAPSFFDVVCYTGDGVSSRVVTSNLAAEAQLIIVKCRSTASTGWKVWAPTGAFALQTNGAVNNVGTTTSALGSGYAVPSGSSGSFQLNSGVDYGDGALGGVNASGRTYLAYLFGTCPGVSKVGSYTGTGALQTIDCGFTTGTRFVLIKRSDSTGDWFVWNSATGISSSNDPYILLNTTGGEITGTNYVDTVPTGFQVTAAAPAGINANGGTYIFLAVA